MINDIISRCQTLAGGVIIQVQILAPILPELTQALLLSGVYITIIDRAPIQDRDTLMHAFYQNCEFPGWFGFNWNALFDCLTDFEWAPAKGYVLIYRYPSVLQGRDPLTWEHLMALLVDVNEQWMGCGIPFKVIIPSVEE